MKKQLMALAHHRRALSKKIEAQRMEVAAITRQWQKPLALADTGLKAVRFMHDHPGLVSGSFAALLSLRGMGIAGIAQKGWRLLYLYPAAVSFGLKYLFSAIHTPSEERSSEADH